MRAKQMVKYIPWLLIICLVVPAMSGCMNNKSKQVDYFNNHAKSYGKLIRWRAFDDASEYNRPRETELPKPDFDYLSEIKVTKYEIKSVVLSEEGDEAAVTAVISYYHERTTAVKTIEDNQLWWKDEESGHWYVDGGLPNFEP